MAQDPELKPPPTPSGPPGRPDQQDIADTDPYGGVDTIDKKYWLDCLDDAERAEADWRKRAREIIQIYRNETISTKGGGRKAGSITFNILFANTEVMLPALYQTPPKPVVRSRFTKVAAPPPMPGMVPPGMTPGAPPMGPPGLPPSSPGGPMMPTPPVPQMPPGPPPMNGPPPMGPPGPPPDMVGAPIELPPPPSGNPAVDLNVNVKGIPAMPQPLPPAPPPPPPPGPPQMPASPPQDVIETAAAVMQKALEIVASDEQSDEAVKLALKDVLLPGRGTCRVRWKPQMKTVPMPGGPLPDGTEPSQEIKIWEEVGIEYVYWEDLLLDPVRASADIDWIAFRHLFTRKALEAEFAGSPQYDQLKTAGKLNELFKWTDESAAQSPVGGGSAMKTAQKLGDKVKKALLWEIWDRNAKQIIWFSRDATGMVFRVDPDSLDLEGFYPIPAPMLAVTTTDSRIPRPFFDLYARLADDLDETSARISNLTKQIKVRGGYNAASKDIADILTAGDSKMIPVEGIDMITGGLAAHIWIMPIVDFMNALDKLFLAREQTKQAVYEIMGISDIMRGATKASETATAQRIKGSMGSNRLEDAKQQTANFCRDLLRLQGDIIAKNFDPETLAGMTGEDVTPEVMAILRSDFLRTCSIDIEADSTVIADEQEEQKSMAMVMQSFQLVMQGMQGLLMTQMLPPPMVIQLGLEMLKMAMHPISYSRGVVELINDFQQQMKALAAMPPPPPPMPPPGPGMGHNGGPPMAGPPGPPGPPNGAGGPPRPPPGPPPGPPPPMM